MQEACEGTDDTLFARVCGRCEGGISGCAGRVKCSSDCHCLLCSSDMTLWESEASPFFPKTKGVVLGEWGSCGVGTTHTTEIRVLSIAVTLWGYAKFE